jgi:hypothetical protein
LALCLQANNLQIGGTVRMSMCRPSLNSPSPKHEFKK